MSSLAKDITADIIGGHAVGKQCARWRNPWACSLHTAIATLLGVGALFLMAQSFLTRQLDPKGCEMSYMRPAYFKFDDFDTEHTRFANKYSLYIYREGGIDNDRRVKGVPVLFIPGNAGSYKQVRSFASEAAYYYHNSVRHDTASNSERKRPLDFFSVDFNEDFTAFHGQTLLDQAEYLNDAISFILSLYHTPSQSLHDSNLPDPASVIIVGHSMGGVVARTMLTMPNYQSKSINTIITLAAPHARPPVSFDGDIVRTYNGINDYWRRAYSQKWAMNNPLWHVTLISIAGGGLDTIVSSDYASVASIVPETHGFTVFTSSIPKVWTGADHLAITWCDQARKSVIHALYDVIDVSKATQTVSRAERMRKFKRRFLTGLEDVAEKALPYEDPTTLLTIEKGSATVSQDQGLVLRSLGQSAQKPKAYLLPVPKDQLAARNFTLLTSEKLDSAGQHGRLEVLFCSAFSAHSHQSATLFQVKMDLSGDGPEPTRLACKNAASDGILLPASTQYSTHPFRNDQQPFTYLQYKAEDLSEHQYVVIVDRVNQHSYGWVVAEFTDEAESLHRVDMSLQSLLTKGVSLELSSKRPLITEVKVPALHSSLLAYNLHIHQRECATGKLFTPLVRQYITDVYESKYFVNVKDAEINLHGVAPYMPHPAFSTQSTNGLSLQIWTDPSSDCGLEISLDVDYLGSLGKLWMRYRIVFAAFPLLIVALVLRHQFLVYDETGVFSSFAESMNECLHTSIPFTLAALTLLSVSLAGAYGQIFVSTVADGPGNDTDCVNDTTHELLLGTQDAFFWFLVPLFGLMCVAICVAINYVILAVVSMLAFLYSLFPSASRTNDDQRTPSSFAISSTRQRVIMTGSLLSLVSTVIPYHFVYVVLCLVQLVTCVRSLRLAKDTRLDTNYNFSNYTHTIFILMLWILPINLPVLVVWIRNLAVHWLTPFSSHHNILSVMPFILLVETLSTGRMIPRVQSRFSMVTNILLFSIGAYAAVYGVTYAYVLHHLANILCAWLVVVHFDVSSLSVKRISNILEPDDDTKKRP
ncbi:PGAP1-domain-containing protein [Bimuria novae-zelandiae CBS 107.79]|uniref:GPI inositol-deacylase n=1 Tax=Bimuria novae-zelandiae CBS 107.79 TaxID=1447943 RepID=A0A6A5VNL3_9PLEO|nr:PGAP1-domain-containing protein [Bimuria novae-zelandiae CBS 107.79]